MRGRHQMLLGMVMMGIGGTIMAWGWPWTGAAIGVVGLGLLILGAEKIQDGE